MISKLDTIVKPPSYHCIVLTLSAIDRNMPPKMILRPSTRKKEGYGGDMLFMIMMCDFFVKNDERAVARLHMVRTYIGTYEGT